MIKLKLQFSFLLLAISLLHSNFIHCNFFGSAFRFSDQVFRASSFVGVGTLIGYAPMYGVYALTEIITKRPQKPLLSAIKPAIGLGCGLTTLIFFSSINDEIVKNQQPLLNFIKEQKVCVSGSSLGIIATTYGLWWASNFISKNSKSDKE